MNPFQLTLLVTSLLLNNALAAGAAEFPIYFESESTVHNLVTMTTNSKEWHFDSKTMRIDTTLKNNFGTFQSSTITMNGTTYHLNHDKKTMMSRPMTREEKTTAVHEFSEASINAAGMKFIEEKTFEGQPCKLYGGNIIRPAAQNNDGFGNIFWIRKSDNRLIRQEMKMGENSTTTTNYRKISTDPALFNRSLLVLPIGYNRTEK